MPDGREKGGESYHRNEISAIRPAMKKIGNFSLQVTARHGSHRFSRKNRSAQNFEKGHKNHATDSRYLQSGTSTALQYRH